jgi:hypothetical protein
VECWVVEESGVKVVFRALRRSGHYAVTNGTICARSSGPPLSTHDIDLVARIIQNPQPEPVNPETLHAEMRKVLQALGKASQYILFFAKTS